MPKECPPGKVLNPTTNRCVKTDGRVGKKIACPKNSPKCAPVVQQKSSVRDLPSDILGVIAAKANAPTRRNLAMVNKMMKKEVSKLKSKKSHIHNTQTTFFIKAVSQIQAYLQVPHRKTPLSVVIGKTAFNPLKEGARKKDFTTLQLFFEPRKNDIKATLYVARDSIEMPRPITHTYKMTFSPEHIVSVVRKFMNDPKTLEVIRDMWKSKLDVECSVNAINAVKQWMEWAKPQVEPATYFLFDFAEEQSDFIKTFQKEVEKSTKQTNGHQVRIIEFHQDHDEVLVRLYDELQNEGAHKKGWDDYMYFTTDGIITRQPFLKKFAPYVDKVISAYAKTQKENSSHMNDVHWKDFNFALIRKK